ncbi:MAG: cytidylate kinase [Kordiimonadales bacterium]|nr:MAG: cytidylate kinase [Kordiimonadales bacterium]
MIIAIDGPAASGKGTLARRLAKHFQYAYLDTGSLYRGVALVLLNKGIDPHDMGAAAQASMHVDLSIVDDPALRSEGTGNAASIVAAMPIVRSNLLEFQRKFSISPPGGEQGAILDGRDIGTVVCPDAPIKLFVTASVEERAKRRFSEMKGRDETVIFEQILADVRARDERDTNRALAPLLPAEDAHLLDTTLLDIDAVFLRAVKIVEDTLLTD